MTGLETLWGGDANLVQVVNYRDIVRSLCFNSQLKTLWPEKFGKPR